MLRNECKVLNINILPAKGSGRKTGQSKMIRHVFFLGAMILCVMMSRVQAWSLNSTMTANPADSGVLTKTATTGEADTPKYCSGFEKTMKLINN